MKDITDLKSIFAKVNFNKIFGASPEFIYLKTNNDIAIILLKIIINTSTHDFFIIGLDVNHAGTGRHDRLILSFHKKDFTEPYLNEVSGYINPTPNTNILGFLKTSWHSNPYIYPITFFLTTRLDADYTHISDLAIAIGYQKKGLMKTIVLSMIEDLKNDYGYKHRLTTFAIHPATYLLFNPHDRNATGYSEGSLEESNCGFILGAHNRERALSTFILGENVKASLLKFGILSRGRSLDSSLNANKVIVNTSLIKP